MHRFRSSHVWSVALGAALAALAVWVLTVPLGGVELAAGKPPVTISPVSVVIVAALATLAAWGVRAILVRLVPAERAVMWWRVTCIGALVISLIGPLGAASLPAFGALVAMHVSVGAAVLVGLEPRRIARGAATVTARQPTGR